MQTPLAMANTGAFRQSKGSGLVLFATLHLGEPLVHLGVLFDKRLFQFLARCVDAISGLPVGLAISKDLIHIGQKLLIACIFVPVHLGLHGSEVHGFGYLFKVIGDIVDGRVNGLPEWADKTRPKSYSAMVRYKPCTNFKTESVSAA